MGNEVASAVRHEVVAIEKDLAAVERKVESVAGNAKLIQWSKANVDQSTRGYQLNKHRLHINITYV